MSQTYRQLALALGLLLAVPVGRAAAEPKRPKITGIACNGWSTGCSTGIGTIPIWH